MTAPLPSNGTPSLRQPGPQHHRRTLPSPAPSPLVQPSPVVSAVSPGVSAISDHPALAPTSPAAAADPDSSELSRGFQCYNDTIALNKAGRGYQPSGYWGADDGADPDDAAARAAVEVHTWGSISSGGGTGRSRGSGSTRSRSGSLPPSERAMGSLATRSDSGSLLPTEVLPSAAPFAVHEDTELLPGAKQQPAADFAVHEDTELLPGASTGLAPTAELPPTEVFAVHEDTELLPRPAAQLRAGSVAVHEDTELLPGAKQQPAAGFAVHEDTELLPRGGVPQSRTFSVHEDTELLPRPAAQRATAEPLAGAGTDLAVHEDNELLPSTKRQPAASFAVHEDTELLPGSQRGQPGHGVLGCAPGAFAVHEDTELLPSSQRGQPVQGSAVHEGTELVPRAATFAVHEDTELLPRPTRRQDSSGDSGSVNQGDPRATLCPRTAQPAPGTHMTAASLTQLPQLCPVQESAAVPQGGGFSEAAVREDSEHPPDDQQDQPSNGFAVHTDTELLPVTQQRQPQDGFVVHEDTELLPSTTQQPAARRGLPVDAAVSPATTDSVQGASERPTAAAAAAPEAAQGLRQWRSLGVGLQEAPASAGEARASAFGPAVVRSPTAFAACLARGFSIRRSAIVHSTLSHSQTTRLTTPLQHPCLSTATAPYKKSVRAGWQPQWARPRRHAAIQPIHAGRKPAAARRRRVAGAGAVRIS